MAGVGELLASAVLKVVLGKLGSEIWKKLMQHVTFKEDLEAIKNMLDSLQAKLKDAERKSQTDGSVRHLLKRLKEVAYDIEDRLAAYESCYNDGNENWSDFCDKVKSRFNLPGEMKKMRQNLEEIKSEMDLTNFTIDGATDEQDWIESRVSEAELLDNKDNVGRIMEKRRIMDLLLFDEDSLFQKEEDIFFGVRTLFGDNEDKSIISIYGLGGLGKTTLAQMVFDDSATKNAFGFLAWVHVSKKFDLNAIRSSIIQQYNKRFQNGDAGSGNVDLESILTEKRCLIVLDDLWEEDDFNLEKIKIVLKKASKVIVTTRTKKVADGMNENVDLQVKLGLLPDEDCWTLFKKRALTSTTTINRHMERTGRMIVEKCQGLPLAVKSLGYILRHLPQTLDQWAAILCSDIWAEDDGPFSDKKVIPSLKLSYYNMPPYMRLCFAYCSVFPKGSHIQRSSLIQQWIALGFFEGLGSDAPERLAEHCLKQLIGMSFLQNVNVSTVMSARYTGFQSVLKMHDLVHELASAVADEQVCIFHAGDRSSSNTGNHCHYLFVSNFNESSQVSILPDRARALHFKECGKFPETLSGTKFLRVLDSSACTIDKLPDSISQLRLLKYLNVSGMISGKLPKLRKLHLLQALTLSKITDLVELPSYICEFLKLHYLDLHGCSNLLKLPEDIDKLKELQHLNLSHCTSIESLPSFSSLSGGLQKLSFLNVSHCSQLRKVHDNYLPNMIDLNMSFCPELQELPTGLFKHMNMLVFLNFAGCASLEVLPELVEDGTGCFMLEVLDLSGCANLHALPNSCCQLIELRFLNLSGCYQLENIMKWILRWKFLGKLEYLNLSGVGAKGDSEAQGTSSRDLESSHDSNKELALMTMLQKDITVVWLRLKYLSIGGFTLYSEQGNIGRDAKLGDLLTLPNFHVRQQDDGECSNILLLQQILDPTHHQLNIKCLQNVVLPEEAKQLELDRKPQFHSLSFEWSLSRDEPQTSRHLGLDRDRERMHRPRARTMPGSDYFDEDEEAMWLERNRQRHFHSLSSRRSLHARSSCQNEHQAKASAVLDNLRPHRNLESLSIKGYISNEFPDWVKKINDTLPYLVKLILSDIEECDYIPAFGHLPNLQELEINNMPMLRDARIGQCMKLRRLTLVALPNGATVNLFYNANIQKEVQTVESCHGFDEEMRETRQEFDMLAGQRACGGPSKFTSKRVHKLRARLNIGTSGRTREKASALSEESKLPPKLSHGCTGVASKAFLELDYLKIEKCNDLNLHPSFPKSKEYFIKDSSLHYLALQNEYTSSFPSEISYSRYSEHPYSQQGTRIPLQEHAMLQSNPGLKSKMHIEGSEEYHFHKWAELITTHLDELIVTHWIYNTRDMHSKAERIIGENDSMENIYGLSQPCIAKLKKFNLRSHSVDQHSQPRSTDNERTCETFIGKNGSQVPYINIGEVAFFWVKPIEVGMFYTSNISLLYKHLEAQSTVVFQNLENVKRPDEVLELANYQQLRSVCLVWSRSNLTEDSSMDQEKAVLQKLRPHQDLETLRIEGYQGDEFCSWMMNINSFLPNLVIIKLSNINKCQWLPPLGQLANLEVLHISDMPRVEGVNGMNSLKDEHKLPQGDDFFPNLQVLSIVNCPRLRLIPAFPGCRECALVKSGNILVSFEQFSRSSNLALITLEINDCGSSSDIVRFLQSSENLEHLTIDSCIDLITLPEPIRKCRSLKKLEIRNCCNFSELPEWLGELTLLQRIEVQATKLECLPQSIRCLTALKLLVLNQCNYKLRAWCQSEKNKGKIKHIERVDMNEVPVLNIHSQRDVMYFRSVTSDHLIELKIGGLNDETDPKEVEKIELREKTDLCSLSLHWDNGTRMHNKTIFEKLLPHDGLEILRIRNYAGVDFPSWMSSLPTLVKLDMDDTRFEHLHLDRLQNLTELHLSKVKCGHLHLDQLQNITKMELSGVEFKQLHLDRLQNLTELHLSEVKCGHLHLDQLQNVTELKLHGQFQRLHFDHLLGLRHLYLSRLQFEHVLLNQLQSLEELHLSQIESLGSNQPACIECTQPLGKLQKILMSEVENQELKIFMQGGEGDENLFPGLQYLKMELCENLRFQPSIPRSTRYTISGKLNRPLSNLASFRRVTGLPTPGSTCTMEIVYTKGLSSQTCELQHLELLDITELTIDYCTDLCPLPKCILGWKTSLRKLEILRCKSIDSLPEWLGEMTSLSELIIETYFMETLHPCIQRLTNLQTLKLSKCFDDKFIERCRESGDDWINIMHIPNIQITGVTGRTEIIAPRCT